MLAWGSDESGQLGLDNDRQNQYAPQWIETLRGAKIKQVAAGWDHSLALSGNSIISLGSRNYLNHEPL